MKTTRSIILALIAFLAVSGCARTETELFENDGSLSATIDCSVNATKAILIDNPGIRLDSKWQAGESIGVFGNGAANIKFSVSEGDISLNGKTAKFKAPSGTPDGALTAYSPYQEKAGASGSDIIIEIPSVQNYTTINGVAQPDPKSNFMAATGTAVGGLTFRNAMAVLKIGQVFDKTIELKKVEFRDLSGSPVCGAASLSWNSGAPKATVTGSGTVITLDCGKGLSFQAGQKGIFFMVVPARAYAKGFELTFIGSDGTKIVKTAGASNGKTLDRSVVYLIGDISVRQAPEGSTSTLKATAQIMTPEKLDKVQILSSATEYIYDKEGKRIQQPGKDDLRMPVFDMLVPKEINPAVGNYLIFDQPTDDLPGGGIYTITKCTKKNADWYEIVAYPETNVAAPFEDMKAGEPLISDSGEIIEGGGIPLDLTSFISSIKDDDGNPVEFGVKDGKVLFSEETVAEMMGLQTKSVKTDRFVSPKLSLNRKDGNVEVSVGGSLTLDTRLAVRFMQGEFQYAQITVTPSITTSFSATLKAEGNIEGKVRIYTIDFLPIPVSAGVMVVPQLVFRAKAGVGGNLQMSASLDITQSLGTYSFAYNKGDGGVLRWVKPAIDNDPSFNPSFGGIEGSIYAYGGIGVNTNLSLYGMFGFGLENYLTFKFGLSSNTEKEGGIKLFLQPEIEVTPSLCSAFGSKKFEDLTGKVELNPIWEKYIIPASKSSVSPVFTVTPETYLDIVTIDNVAYCPQITTGIQKIEYNIKLQGDCVEDLKVVLLAFEGSSIKITPMDSRDPYGSKLLAFRAAGVEHLYFMFFMCDKSLQGVNEDSPFHVFDVGTYTAGTEEQVFEGSVSGSVFQSGHMYGVVPAVKSGDSYRILDRGGYGNAYTPFCYWWPNRSNGTPYK